MTFENEIRYRAMAIAGMHGGQILSHGETRAFRVGMYEGWWRYGRGVFNGDCIELYIERHWPDYIGRAQMVHS